MEQPPLHSFQSEAIELISRDRHLLCVAPTGAGKTRIVHELARGPCPRVVLVTPLVALGRQHEEKAREAGIRIIDPPATRGHAGLLSGPGIWITSPEALEYAGLLSRLRRWRPDLLVVDECHCVEEWGREFRPAFRRLPGLVRELGIQRSLWLTATISPEARRALGEALGAPLADRGEFELGGNLFLARARVPLADRLEVVRDWIGRRSGRGIVFVATRTAAERLAGALGAGGAPSVAYHAGMSREERMALELRLRGREPEIVVATPALGLGMDLPHLEWAVQWQAPISILSLAQAIGRIGRNRARHAEALITWDREDLMYLEAVLGDSPVRMRELIEVSRFLEDSGCIRAALSKYFSKTDLPVICNGCSSCGRR